jgi:hypothetical protein
MNSRLENIREKNKDLTIHECGSDRFSRYGKIIHGIDPSLLIAEALKKTNPAAGVEYIPSVPELESVGALDIIRNKIFSGKEIQAGWVRGENLNLNAFEFHESSEVIAAATDLILILGRVNDITGNTYDTAGAEIFYQERGSIVELFSTTLHFAPVQTGPEGFCAVIILPAGTNTPLNHEIYTSATGKQRLLFMKNKWLLAYEGSVPVKKFRSDYNQL